MVLICFLEYWLGVILNFFNCVCLLKMKWIGMVRFLLIIVWIIVNVNIFCSIVCLDRLKNVMLEFNNFCMVRLLIVKFWVNVGLVVNVSIDWIVVSIFKYCLGWRCCLLVIFCVSNLWRVIGLVVMWEVKIWC